jgi:5-methylcytosine-specific restriction endonuclease McrA
MIRTYGEMLRRSTFYDRFEYLKLGGSVGLSTAGFDRWINQRFYRSREWKSLRQDVIFRDDGCDLGVPGHEIHGSVLVHHLNPVSVRDIVDGLHWILNPEYLITTCHDTHNAIHYGDASLLPQEHAERSPGDTRLW